MSCYISVSLISENNAYIIKYILSAKHILSSVCDLSILVRGLIETYSADYAICQRLAETTHSGRYPCIKPSINTRWQWLT